MLKNLLLLLISILFSYLLVEVFYSYLHINHFINQKTIWFHEASDPGNNIVFHPHIGYTISETPSRFGAVTSNGQLESIGIMKGNNLGFPDKKDFFPNKMDSTIKRIAVLGDSFTASQFTEKNWVEMIEDSLNQTLKDSIILMNFSVDGGGLGNWSSIVKNILLENDFELDGVVFALLGDDLDRQFMWKNDYVLEKGEFALAAGKNDTWAPTLNPGYDDTLNPFFLESYLVLSTEKVNDIINGNWKEDRKLNAYLFNTFKQKIKAFIFQLNYPELFNTAHATPSIYFSNPQEKLIEDLANDCNKLNMPIITFSFLTDHQKSKAFASIINSHFLDDVAFQNNLRNSTKNVNIKGDGHWNTYGTKLFANSMFKDFKDALKDAEIIDQ